MNTHIASLTLLTLLLTSLTLMPSALANDHQSAHSDETSTARPRDRSTHFLSTSVFMLGNLLPEDPPMFAQLNYGWRPTKRDTILVEAITWRYPAPLGIPLWSGEYGSEDNRFPGYVQAFGVGLAYQRYLWRGLFATLHATPFLQHYRDEQGDRIQSGFQLFVVARLGYNIPFWKDRLFIEPSIAATSWFINTNLPDSFEEKESRWPSFFVAEPGLNIGYNF